MQTLRNWWWPVFVFVYPLLVWPGRPELGAAFIVHAYFTVAFIAIGLVLEFLEPDWRSLSLRRALTGALRRHPPVVLAVVFGAWVVATSFFALDVPIALTGSLVGLGDGAMWMIAMVAVFVLVYVRTLHTPRVGRLIAFAVVASGLVLTAGALLEVLLRHGLAFNLPVTDLPMVSFPQKGHLSGMIALAGGVAVGLAPAVVVSLLGLGIGLCLNRTAAFALLIGTLTPLLRGRRFRRATAITAVLVLAGVAVGIVVSKKLTDSTKVVDSAHTLESRTFYYRSAIRGIASRPILGWGGGNFEFAWPSFLSADELNRFGQMEWGFQEVFSAKVSRSGPPVLSIRDRTGKLAFSVVRTFKAHDQVLEAALMWGIPGALLYLSLFALGLRGVRRGEPLAIGILVYGVFTLLWFVIPQTQGLLWVMLAASIALQRATSQSPDPATQV